MTVPNFHFLNKKGEQPEIAFPLEEHILKMEMVHSHSKPISIDEKRQACAAREASAISDC